MREKVGFSIECGNSYIHKMFLNTLIYRFLAQNPQKPQKEFNRLNNQLNQLLVANY